MDQPTTQTLRIPPHGTCAERSFLPSEASSLDRRSVFPQHERTSGAEPARPNRSRTRRAGTMAELESSAQPKEVIVKLRDQSLWNSFRREQTEMIITKAGRRMFPFLDFTVSGLKPDQYYSCAVEVVPADEHRYRYHKLKGWIPAGGGTPSDRKYCHYLHTNSASLGRYWMEHGANFDKMKLTNHFVPGSGHVVLASMQKYRVRFLLTKLGVQACDHWMFDFPETEFLTVTSYQNARMTGLKIQHNPFAKAFRDGKRKTKNPGTSNQCKRRCARFPSPPPITRYQSPFISSLNRQGAPVTASAPVPALPPPPQAAPALPPPPLSHEPYDEPYSTRPIPTWNDLNTTWEAFEDQLPFIQLPPLQHPPQVPSISTSFKVEVCGSYTQRHEAPRACATQFEEDFYASVSQNCLSSASSCGGYFDGMPAAQSYNPLPNHSMPYDAFWREI